MAEVIVGSQIERKFVGGAGQFGAQSQSRNRGVSCCTAEARSGAGRIQVRQNLLLQRHRCRSGTRWGRVDRAREHAGVLHGGSIDTDTGRRRGYFCLVLCWVQGVVGLAGRRAKQGDEQRVDIRLFHWIKQLV